ncbi:MAG: hypothetical protein ACMUIE_05350 [Thermoplasmatota archaeon]
MPMFDGPTYDCMICGRHHVMGTFNKEFDRPVKCRKCKGWVCVVCHRSDKKAMEDFCPRCGGELYRPLFGP